jgi:hypothetical protein
METGLSQVELMLCFSSARVRTVFPTSGSCVNIISLSRRRQLKPFFDADKGLLNNAVLICSLDQTTLLFYHFILFEELHS